jgi:hypothetical protein
MALAYMQRTVSRKGRTSVDNKYKPFPTLTVSFPIDIAKQTFLHIVP